MATETAMLKKIVLVGLVLVGLAILIPLGVANAKRYYKRGDQPADKTEQHQVQFTCLTGKNCWCDLDVEFWQEGTACECSYYGGPAQGHAVRVSKLMVGTPVCPTRVKPEPQTGGGLFKQMKP
jgi:hypothetical protein